MVNHFQRFLFIALWLAAASQAVLAQVSRTEQRLSEEISTALTAGSAVQLGDPEQAFLGVFLEAETKKSRGGIILLHDVNNHADWPEVIAPLRQNLPRYGWHTLSIQLPTVSASLAATSDSAQWDSLEQEVQRRIQAAIKFCQDQRIFNLVLLGHQFGAVMASRYIAKQAGNNSLSALVTLNLYSPATRAWTEADPNRALVTNIQIAFLDIVPGQSTEYVLELAERRKSSMTQSNNDKFKQIHIIGTDYTFRGAEQTLISRIHGWLTKLAPSMEVQITPKAK
jgi:alpha/beta superfamily hydrolase